MGLFDKLKGSDKDNDTVIKGRNPLPDSVKNGNPFKLMKENLKNMKKENDNGKHGK